jgi:NAD(P)-dependent dehydrogenase (short-subunit alcohol dehydrogenase family)
MRHDGLMEEHGSKAEQASMNDRVIVVTGASDGIGAATARLLKGHGAHVVIVGRSPEKTEKVANVLRAPYYLADYARLDDVRALAAKLRADLPRIDVLANNAGGVMGDRRLTVDGNERTVQVNHLAPFLLTNLLLDTLTASRATVIATSSLANRGAGKLDLSDINLEHGYSAQRAYGRAKLMNILFTRELDKRYRAAGIAAASFQPGTVRTSFSSEFGGGWSFVYSSFIKSFLRSPDKGAETLVWLATSKPGEDWKPGEFYKDKKVCGATKQAYDANLARDLWEASATLTTPQ